MAWSSISWAIREKAKGAPVEFVFPAEGVSAVTEPVAILKTARNPETAKKFVDFLLSEEGSKCGENGLYPGARRHGLAPEGFPARETIKVLRSMLAEAVKNSEADLKTFSGFSVPTDLSMPDTDEIARRRRRISCAPAADPECRGWFPA